MKKIAALLIDGENVNPSELLGVIQNLQSRFSLPIRRLYADFSQPSRKVWKHHCSTLGLMECQASINVAGKNTVDIALTVDACDLCFTKEIENIVLVASDSDYTFLAKRLREKGVYVIGVVRSDCHVSLVNACSETIKTKRKTKTKT